MNQKIFTYSLLSLLPVFMLFSCAQDEVEGGRADEDSRITFVTGLPGVKTRAEDVTLTTLQRDGFYVTAFCPQDASTISGSTMNEYVKQQKVSPITDVSNVFKSDECRWYPSGTLYFFAYSPSIEEMQSRIEGGDQYFELKNGSTKTTATYSLLGFRVSQDISNHVDLVIARGSGTKSGNMYSGVSLNFVHPLSRIELKAWGNPDSYDVEIAGVRIAYMSLQGDFKYPTSNSSSSTGNATRGTWSNNTTAANQGDVEYIYRDGDIVFRIGSGSHTSSAKAESIMGNAGPAMVIPYNGTQWGGNSDTKKRYLSVLLRVKDKSDMLLYPYINGVVNNAGQTKKMNVVYLAVEKKTGKVLTRVYKKDDIYYTDGEFSNPYTVPGDAEVRDYGWAAIKSGPTTMSAGSQYVYTLNYSEGIGLEDPHDPNPGQPIISAITPSVTEITVNDFEPTDTLDVSKDIIIK